MRRRDRDRLQAAVEWMAAVVQRGTAPTAEERAQWDAHRSTVLELVDELTAQRLLREAVDRAAAEAPADAPAAHPPLVPFRTAADEREAWRKVVAMRRGHPASRVLAPTLAERRPKDAPEVLRAAGRADMRRWTPWR